MPDRYKGPLYGDQSVAELAEKITETMPEDDPEKCIGDEAQAVAEFIYHEFYSKKARLEKGLLTAPRIELARLTVPQYRNAVADLIAAFTPPPRIKAFENLGREGLQATYFQSEKMNKTNQLRLKRVDRNVDFNFMEGSPAETIKPDQFAIVWQGSLRTQNTGYYHFRIQTPNGVRVYINADDPGRSGILRDDDGYETIQARLIDAWVSSGKMRTLTGRIFLLGGRQYPIRVEFFKYKEPNASVRLEWKPPHSVWSLLDRESLSPQPATRIFTIDAPFPADDRSLGYERGSSISSAWHTAVTNAAIATADEVCDRLYLLTNVPPAKRFRFAYKGKKSKKDLAARDALRTAEEKRMLNQRNARLPDFSVQFASTAFRRPLTAAEETLYRHTIFEDVTPESAIRRAVLLTMTSPHFLYTDLAPVNAPPTSHTIAARLGFALWDSLPDAELRRVADLDRLATPEQIDAQADRMLADPRTRAKMQAFFRHWLELEERDLAKDQQLYPDFDEAVIADLRRSLELFVDRVVWNQTSDYRELLLADYLLLNKRLQRLYAKPTSVPDHDLVADHRFVSVGADPEERSGILTHPYLLSAFAYHDNTSPIHRGVFLTRNIVGRQLKPPPVAVAFENNDFAPDLTMREKVTELTRDQACVSCHEVINPLGFALENFDAVGRWRTREKDKPIDTQSAYTSAEGTTMTIGSARDIANFAVTSPVAQRAFVRQVFQHLVRQSPSAYDPDIVEQLRQSFVDSDFHIQKLLLRIATHAATHHSEPSDNQEPSP